GTSFRRGRLVVHRFRPSALPALPLVVPARMPPGAPPRGDASAARPPEPPAAAPPAALPAATPAAAALPAATPSTVRIGLHTPMSNAGFFVAIERGYVAEQGLRLEVEPLDTAAKMIAPLSSGQLDAGAGTISPAVYN